MKFFPKFEKTKSLFGIRVSDIEEFFKLFHQNNLKKFRLKSGDFSINIESYEQDNISQKEYVNKESEKLNFDNYLEIDKKENNENRVEKILAPITGTFYTSPAPGKPPFVKTGDSIDENTIVCIIESMKVMNEIKSNIAGKVKKRVVENGDKVKKGDLLFLIERV